MSNPKSLMKSKPSTVQKGPDAMTRLNNLEEDLKRFEEDLKRIVHAFNTTLSGVQRKLDAAERAIEAITGLVGAEAVAQAARDNQVRDMREAADVRRANLEKALQDGVLVTADKARAAKFGTGDRGQQVILDSGSLLEGVEFNSEGDAIEPGWLLMAAAEIHAAYQDKVEGASAGTEIQLFELTEDKAVVSDESGNPKLSGRKFVISRIFEQAPPKSALAAVPEPAPATQVAPTPTEGA